MRHHFARYRHWIVSALLALCARPALAQLDNPVYINDSPQAWELFRRAVDQVKDNPTEALARYQELLDDYASKVMPANTGSDHYVSVRSRVLAELSSNDALLERYQLSEDAQAQRLLDAGDLQRLAITRSLTEPGLEALLRLAQENLEAGRFLTARRWLAEAAEHASLTGRRATHYRYMLGLAAYYLSDKAGVDAALAALSQDNDSQAKACLDHLKQIATTPPAPSVAERGVSPLDRVQFADLRELVDQPIWQIPIENTSPGGAIEEDPGDRSLIPRPGSTPTRGEQLTMAATIAGSAVYINTGQVIRAVDRFTGRMLWPESGSPLVSDQMLFSNGEMSPDLNIVAVGEGSVVAMLDQPLMSPEGRMLGGKIVCVDPATGRERWPPFMMQDVAARAEGDALFPHGAPVIAEGCVYFIAHKSTSQLLTSCYVVALDLQTGALRWSLHVASVGGMQSRDGRALSTLVYDGGQLFIASSIGAIASIDAATGQTNWLRRYSTPINAGVRSRWPWDLGAPLLTPRGVLALQPDQSRVVLLDRETGADVEPSHDATDLKTWGSPRYFLAGENMVIAVGRDIRAFELDQLQTPVWRLPDVTPEARQRSGLGERALEIRGRVQVIAGSASSSPSGGTLLVPTAEGLLLVDQHNGQIVHELPMEKPGNPLVVDSQLIMASDNRLAAYMPFRRAEEILRQRIASEPSDAQPSLSLLQMALRARNLKLVLEAAELALKSVNSAPLDVASRQNRQELFQMLLSADHEKIASTLEEGEALHALIGTVAVDPSQRVEHLLAYGDWLAGRNILDRAVESYQSILSDPAIAGAMREEAMVLRPAASVATLRLAALIERHGAAVYARESDFARTRVAELTASGQASPQKLLALAQEFPLADSAVDAVLLAAKLHGEKDDWRAAAGSLMWAYRLAPTRSRAERLLGPLVGAYSHMGWLERTQSLLAHATRKYPDLQLATAEGPRDAAQWLSQMPMPAPPRLPRLGAFKDQGTPLKGSLVPAYNEQAVCPPDRVLLIDGTNLQMRSAAKLETLWSHDIGSDSPQLLLADDDRVLIWAPGKPPTEPKAIMLDAKTGQERWTSRRFTDALDAGEADLRSLHRAETEMPDGGAFDPAEILPLLSGKDLVLVRRTGDAVALDLATGNQVKWRKTAGALQHMEQVHAAMLAEQGLILAGRVGHKSETTGSKELIPQILVLDPATGAVLLKHRPMGDGGVIWMSLTPLGDLVYGTLDGVEMIDILQADSPRPEIWTSAAYYARAARRAWAVGDRMVLEDRTRALRSLDAGSGAISDAFDAPVAGDWNTTDLVDVKLSGDRLIAQYKQRVICFDAGGTLVGADVIDHEREYKALLQSSDGMVLVSKFSSMQEFLAGGRERRTSHVYRIYRLTDSCALKGEPLELEPITQRLKDAALADGWLLLSFEGQTVAVPAPAKE